MGRVINLLDLTGHHPSLETGISTADIIDLVQNLGTPMVTVLCCLWFIRHIYDQNAKERENFLQRDEDNDKRAFELAQNCNEAMSKLAHAVEMNTKAIEQNGRAVTEMVNLLKAKVIQ